MKRLNLKNLNWSTFTTVTFLVFILVFSTRVFAAATPEEFLNSNCPKEEVSCILKTSLSILFKGVATSTSITIENTKTKIINSLNKLSSTSDDIAFGWSTFTNTLLDNTIDSLNNNKNVAIALLQTSHSTSDALSYGWSTFTNTLIDNSENAFNVHKQFSLNLNDNLTRGVFAYTNGISNINDHITSTLTTTKDLGLSTTASVGDSMQQTSEGLSSGWSVFINGIIDNTSNAFAIQTKAISDAGHSIWNNLTTPTPKISIPASFATTSPNTIREEVIPKGEVIAVVPAPTETNTTTTPKRSITTTLTPVERSTIINQYDPSILPRLQGLELALLNNINHSSNQTDRTYESVFRSINSSSSSITEDGVLNRTTINQGKFHDSTINNATITNSTFSGTNVTADQFIGPVEGNVTGNVLGNLTGNVTGDVTGNVTGDLTGNADTVTNGVYTSRTINGHDLSTNVTVTAADVLLGNVTNESKTTMFTSPTFTGTVSGFTVGGDIIASTGSLNLGSVGTRMGTIYTDSIDATNIRGNIVTGSTSSTDWTVNSGNSTNDTQDSSVAFERGTQTPNALFTWDATNKRFTLNAPLTMVSSIGTANITGNVIGNVQGNVTGNLTGNVTGSITGNVTGNLTGNVTGNLTGDVTGNTSGNAGTVTNGIYTNQTYSNPSWLTAVPYSILSGTVPTWNQNTTGTSAKATILETARTIANVSFNGSSDISIASTNLSDTTNLARLDAANRFGNTGDTSFAGKVGVGTTTPGATLDVNGANTSIFNTYTNGILSIGANTGANAYTKIYGMDSIRMLTYNGGYQERLYINNNGDVGIGMTPTFRLDVNSTGRMGGVIVNAYPGVNNSLGATGGSLYLEGTAGGAIFVRPNGTGSNTGLFALYSTGFNSTGTGNSMIAGNLGVGTTSPSSKLSINGGLHVGGDSDAGDNNILADGTITGTQIISSIATGIAPFSVTSTTPVANLSIGGNAATVTNGLYSTGSYSNPTWLTGVPYSILTGTVPTWNQNTTGNAATATNVAYSGLTGIVPTWNQNTTGSADKWGGILYYAGDNNTALNVLFGANANTGSGTYYSANSVKTWLGLGSNAYNSTAYQPLEDQRLSTGNNVTFNNITSSQYSDGYITINSAQINRPSATVELQYTSTGGVRIFGNSTYPVYFNGTSGNVGIGTTSPAYKLHVVGNSDVAATSPAIELENTSTNAANRNWLIANGMNNYGDLEFSVGSTLGSTPVNGSGTKLTILSTGNVGIGTTNPNGKFEVFDNTTGGVTAGDIVFNTKNAAGSNAVYLGRLSSTGGDNTSIIFRNRVGVDVMHVDTAANKVGIMDSAPGVNLSVVGNAQIGYASGSTVSAGTSLAISGNVGIGTTTPGAKLEIQSPGTSNQDLFSIRSGYNHSGTYEKIFAVTQTGSDGYVNVGDASGNTNVHLSGYNSISAPSYILGNVGIGTTTPLSKLTIGDGVAAPNGTSTLTLTGANTAPEITTKPGLYHRDQVGLGVFSDYAISFQVNGATSLSDAMRINNLGNVGIGTTTPAAKFSLGATTGIKQLVYDGNANYNTGFGTNLISGMSSLDIFAGYGTGSDTAINFVMPTGVWPYSGYSSKMTILTNGNVGIGTTSPNFPLVVNGTAGRVQIDQSTGLPTLGFSNGEYTGVAPTYNTRIVNNVMGNTTASLDFILGTTPNAEVTVMTMKGTGNVGIGTTAPGAKLHIYSVNSPTNAYDGELMIGGYLGTTNDMALVLGTNRNSSIATIQTWKGGTGGVNLALNPQGGNVGIGTMSPGAKLHISDTSGTNGISNSLILNQVKTIANGDGNAIYFSENNDYTIGSAAKIYNYITDYSDHTSQLRFATRYNNGTYGPWDTMTLVSGNVGIGTTSPNGKLEIKDSTASAILTRFNGFNGRSLDIVNGSADNVWEIGGSGAAVTKLGFVNTDSSFSVGIGYADPGTATLAINGNVGIGTTTPNAKLHITNTSAGSSAIAALLTNNDGTAGTETRLAFTTLNADPASNRFGYIGYVINGVNGGDMRFATNVAGAGPVEAMRINNIGNVGIGTTTPAAKFSLGATNGIKQLVYDGNANYNTGFGTNLISGMSSLDIFAGYGTGSDTAINFVMPTGVWPYSGYSSKMTILTNGNVGIGTTNPGTFKLQVAGNVGPDATNSYNLGAAGSNWGCLYYNNGTLGTCASDERLKTKFADLKFTNALQKVAGLKMHTYSFIIDTKNNLYNGLIAQEVEQIAPELVVTDPETTMKAVKYGDIQWMTIQAIQEMDLKVTSIDERLTALEKDNSTLGASAGGVVGSSIDSILASFNTLGVEISQNIVKLKDLIAHRVTSETELCINSTCVNEAQLKELLKNLPPTNGGSGTPPDSAISASGSPVIALNDARTMEVIIGSSYAEPGATAKDSAGADVDVTITGEVKTDTLGEYLVKYNATDSAGKVANEVIRTVRVIEAPAQAPAQDPVQAPNPAPVPPATPPSAPAVEPPTAG